MSSLQPHDFQPGDILGFSGHALSSALINLATYGIPFWHLSHCGIIGEHDGRLVLFESMYEDPQPCIIQRKMFSGTQAHEIGETLDRYPGKAWHYPLYRRLYGFERVRLNKFLHSTVGVPYDKIGAFRAGGFGWSWIESLFHPADLSSVFCSEWCCAAHTEIGIFPTDHVGRYSPNRLIRQERRQGILQQPRRLK